MDKEKVKKVVYEMSKVTVELPTEPFPPCRPTEVSQSCIADIVKQNLFLQDSAHFRNDLRKQSQTEERIRRMKRRPARSQQLRLQATPGLLRISLSTTQHIIYEPPAWFSNVRTP